MSRARRLRRQQNQTALAEAQNVAKTSSARTFSKTAAKSAGRADAAPQLPVPRAPLWLAAAFLIPNLGALACGFVFDDRVLIVQNQSLHVHSLSQLAHIWKAGYWPDNHGLELYRPIAQTVWALAWAAGGGPHPALFHAIGLTLGLAVVLLLYRFLLAVRTPPRTAFLAALLFALFPIHTDATTSVVGSAELLAAAFSLGALLLYYRDRPIGALLLFALAVFSKESAAAFAALPLVLPRKDARPRHSGLTALGAAAIVGAALLAHQAVSRSSQIPPIDNPMALVHVGQRILTALWVQCLYVFKTLVPITLSADYSYQQIRLVMGLDDWRAWAGLALAGGALWLAWRRPEFRPAVLAYAILFSPTANVLFPIGTIMGERLVYAPSLGLALLLAWLLTAPMANPTATLAVPSRYWKAALLAVALVFAVRTAVRNRDWLNAEHFYTKLAETSPRSAKSHYSLGVLRSSSGDDASAIEAYDRAIAIMPGYAEAFRNRGNALARLGRREEAIASYRQCLRFDPQDFAANYNLRQLLAGLPVNPPRAPL
jgi:protein O-mannosyl-transferase